MSDFEEDLAQSGSKTVPVAAGTIKKGGYIVIKDRPCKVVSISTCKTGKHGAAKATIVATDIFTGQKYQDSTGTQANVDVPLVHKTDYTVCDVNDGECSFINAEGEESSIAVPAGDVGARLVKLFGEGKELLITIMSSMDESQIVDVKESTMQ